MRATAEGTPTLLRSAYTVSRHHTHIGSLRVTQWYYTTLTPNSQGLMLYFRVSFGFAP